MKTVIYNGRIITPDTILDDGYIILENGKIADVGRGAFPESPDVEKIDAMGCYVSPGFIDIHLHGGGGSRFIDTTKEAIIDISRIHAEHGTTTIFPTVSFLSYERMLEVLDNIARYKDEAHLNIAGVHMEGPYCSKKQIGAQNASVYRDPVKEEYESVIERYGDLIKRWSYAPENEGTLELQKYLKAHGILGAIAHSDATYGEIMPLYTHGLRTVTHLYSCTSTITRKDGFRRLGIIETAFLMDDFYVEVIADGCHLPPELLKMIYKIKGDKRICLVTDATRYGGADETTDVSKRGAEAAFIIEDGVAKLPDRSAFVGSIATADRLVRTCVKDAGIPLSSAVRMMTLTPAELFGLSDKGRLAVGCDADVVIFDDDIKVNHVIISGKIYK